MTDLQIPTLPTWTAEFWTRLADAPERAPWTPLDADWHPEALDYEPAPMPPSVPLGVVLVSLSGLLIALWLLWTAMKAAALWIALWVAS